MRNKTAASISYPWKALRSCRPLAVAFVLVTLWCWQLRSSVDKHLPKVSSDTLPVVILCGYKFWRFCEAVFPEYNCRRADGEGTTIYNRKDILLSGMHAQCQLENTFPGTVVYMNGEPNVTPRAKNSFYLGPVVKNDVRSMQFYFVSLAALQIPEAYSSFTQRRKNSGKGFLLYVSRRCLQHREEAFHMFSSIDAVTAGGKCDGTTLNGRSFAADKFNKLPGTGPWSEAHSLYSDFKFGLVMENTKQRGYVSEKILNAFIGGTIPIYFGTEDVFNIFNRDAFVFFNEDRPQETIENVRALLADEEKYNSMLAQPILAAGAFDRFFALYGKGKASAEIRRFLGLSAHPPEEDD